MNWFENIDRWHKMGLWSDTMVLNAVRKSKITQEQADQIIAGK